MERPVAAFDRIAETSERARRRLREDPEIDEVAMGGILDRAEPREEHRVHEAPDPEKPIAHALRDRIALAAAGRAR